MAGVGVLGGEPVDAGGLAEDLRRGEGAAAGDGQQCWGERFDLCGEFGRELIDLGGELAGAGQ